MGKFLGENFDDFVRDQINTRQKKLGITEYDNELITYTTSKDSWIRLASGVDVSQEKLAELDISPLGKFPKGNSLAESYVLFGGANNVAESSKPKGGLIDTYTDSILANASYGFDSTAEYGLTPLPGVTSFNIKPKNDGSITEGEIKIKCYNIQQFNHIESLYLRLGYTLLLEWGHTIYFNNDGSLTTQITDDTDGVLRTFLGVPIKELIDERKALTEEGNFTGPRTETYTPIIPTPDPQTTILNLIKNARKTSCGNYDAMIGRVKNFEWTVTPTGEYEISVSVLSPGSIVESLSISTALPSKDPGQGVSSKPIVDPIESTSIGKILSSFKTVLSDDYNAIERLVGGGKPESALGELEDIIVTAKNEGKVCSYYYTTKALTNSNIVDLTGLEVTPLTSPLDQSTIPKREIIRLDPKDLEPQEENGSSNSLFYIKFGALLRIIQNFLLLYNTSADNAPIIAIDYDYASNKCFIPSPNIFSSDPRVCLIPSRFSGTFIKKDSRGRALIPKDIDFKTLNEVTLTDFQNEEDYSYNFMHIFLSIDNLYSIIKNNINSSGELALIDFLTAVCTGVNTSLSNTTEFAPFLDTDTNILHITNKRNSDPIIENTAPPSKFQIGFLHNNGSQGLMGIENGSFVTDVSIQSTIPPNFATQISIGAQANKALTEPNAFSKWNIGYTDRIFLDKQLPKSPTVADETAEVDLTAQFEKTSNNTKEAGYLNSKFQFNEDLFKLSTDINQFFKIETTKAIEKNEEFTAPIMIPISLSLTLDGMSGMKIFNKYTITEDFLPQSYKENIEFLIKGINHTIDGNGWVTNLEGQFMPKAKKNNS